MDEPDAEAKPDPKDLDDEILVDVMRSAGGIVYEEAAKDVVVREIQGVPIRLADILEVMRRMSADQAAHRRNRWAEALRRAKDWEQLDK